MSSDLTSGMENTEVIKIGDIIHPVSIPSMEKSQNCGNKSTRYWQDYHQLLSLLPKEVWHHICSFLDTQTFLNLINSSLFFRELFLQKRTLLLYPPILSILIPKLEAYVKPSDQTDYHEDVRGILLESRVTCKTWKTQIDKIACIWKPEESETKNLVQYILSKNFTFKDSREIDNFIQYFQISHPPNSNPSPAKYIDLHIRLMEEDYPQLINRISTLLKKYGENLITLEISIMFVHLNPPELHHKIVEWLNCTPNLETLLFYTFIPLRSNFPQLIQPVELLPSKLNFLRKLAIETFVPPLSNEQIPEWGWMERYNLSKLIEQHDNDSNLELLKITMFNKCDFKYLENLKSPLKILDARFHFKEDDITLAQVFIFLREKFSNCLENLVVRFRANNEETGHLKIMRDCLNGRLNLGKVRIFEVDIRSMFCLDFILGMKDNLEELAVSCEHFDLESFDFSVEELEEIRLIEERQIIKFLGYQDKMLESNIWRLFPKLEVISLTVCRNRREFKREDWMKIQ